MNEPGDCNEMRRSAKDELALLAGKLRHRLLVAESFRQLAKKAQNGSPQEEVLRSLAHALDK